MPDHSGPLPAEMEVTSQLFEVAVCLDQDRTVATLNKMAGFMDILGVFMYLSFSVTT